MTTVAVRVGFLAGRGLGETEISEQTNLDIQTVRRILQLGGVRADTTRGLCVTVRINIEACVLDIDAVGRKRRMNREEIAADVLRIVLHEGEKAIKDTLDRGA